MVVKYLCFICPHGVQQRLVQRTLLFGPYFLRTLLFAGHRGGVRPSAPLLGPDSAAMESKVARLSCETGPPRGTLGLGCRWQPEKCCSSVPARAACGIDEHSAIRCLRRGRGLHGEGRVLPCGRHYCTTQSCHGLHELPSGSSAVEGHCHTIRCAHALAPHTLAPSAAFSQPLIPRHGSMGRVGLGDGQGSIRTAIHRRRRGGTSPDSP